MVFSLLNQFEMSLNKEVKRKCYFCSGIQLPFNFISLPDVRLY